MAGAHTTPRKRRRCRRTRLLQQHSRQLQRVRRLRRPSEEINVGPARRRGIAGDRAVEVGANFGSRRGRTVAVRVGDEVEQHSSAMLCACCAWSYQDFVTYRTAHLEEKRAERFHRGDRDRVR